jgi:hypothetical protein
MAGVTGRTVKIAFAKYAANSWTVAASVTKGAYFMSDQGMITNPEVIEDKSFGQVYIGPSDRGNLGPVEPTFQAQSRYDDNNYILEAIAMGSPNAVTISTSAAGQTTSWSHVIDLSDVVDGLGATFAADLGNYVKEITSAKIAGFTEGVSANESVQTESFYVLGNDALSTSSVNINSTVAGAIFPALANRIQKKNGTLRMNVKSGSGLSSGDALPNVDSVQFEFRRAFDRSFSLGSANIVEPAENDFPSFKMTVTFNRMTTLSANSLRAAFPANTVMKADWTSLGAYINSTDQYTKKYEFPHCEVAGFVDTVAGAQQVKPQVTFNIYKPSSAPTGMSWGTRPFRLTRIMTNSIIAF